MIKINRRLLTVAVTIFMVLSFMTVTVLADEKTAQDGQINLYSNRGTFTVSGTTVTYTNSISGLSFATSYELMIYNYSGSKATISFDYIAGFGDSCSLDGTTLSNGAKGTYSATLDSGSYISITATSKCGTGGQTDKFTINNLKLTVVSESVITFTYDSSLGSITAAGSAIANNGTYTNTDTENGVALVATPKGNAKFVGWINSSTNEIISRSESCSYLPTTNTGIQAVFTNSDSNAWFMASNTYLYNDLNAAVAKAKNVSPKTVIVMSDGILPAGSYDVVSGVTFLVPFDSAHTLYTTDPVYAGETMTTPTAYRTLTMASGANIIINGAMSVSGQYTFTNAGGQSGSPTGPLGFVEMELGSNITINSGGNLYAYGYIIGDGTVTAKSGATVYEILQMPEYRGGDQSTGMEHNVFPLSQFYVQNIEVPLTLEAGATENTYGKILASKMYFTTGITLFGSGGMFELESGTVTKWYDGSTDRLNIEINGDAKMNSVELTMSGSILGGAASINSKDYVLPIHGGFTICLKSGKRLTIPSTQKLLLQPGAQVIIEKDATCTVNGALYLYDAAQWGAYCTWGHAGANDNHCWDTPLIPVSYSPTRTQTRLVVIPRGPFKDDSGNDIYITDDPAIYEAVFGISAENSGDYIQPDDLAEFLTMLPDASILVNGTLTGNIYTTENGANIYSTGSGVFTQNATTGSSVYQFMMAGDYEGNSGYVEAASNPAWLKNENTTGGEYTTSAATSTSSTTYYYSAEHKRWVKDGHSVQSSVTEPTCTEAGYTTYACTCGVTYTGDEVAATDHSWSAWEVTTAATFSAPGVQTRTCSQCNASETQEIPQKVAVAVVPVSATQGYYCETLTEALTYAAENEYGKIVLCANITETVVVEQTVAIYKNSCTANLSAATGYVMTERADAWVFAPEVESIQFDAIQLSVEGEVILRLKFYIPQSILAEDTITVTWTEEENAIEVEKTTKLTMADLKVQSVDDKGRYILEQGIASGEMTGEVTVKFQKADGTAIPIYEDGTAPEVFTKTVVDFARQSIAEGSETMKNLSRAMVIFGGYAQAYFNTDAQNPAYNVLTELGVTIPDIEEYATYGNYENQVMSTGKTEIGIAKVSQKLILDSKIGLVTYFTPAEGTSLGNCTFTLTYTEGGEEKTKVLEATEVSGRYRIDIENIPVAYWDYMYKITISDGTNTYELSSSVLAWARRCIESTSAGIEAQKNVAKTMFFYNDAANEYFGK